MKCAFFRFLNRVFIKVSETRQRAQSVPARKISIPDTTEDSAPSSLKSRGSARCPTCSGKPIVSTVVNNFDRRKFYNSVIEYQNSYRTFIAYQKTTKFDKFI